MLDLIQLYELNDFTYTKNEIINTVTGSNMIFKGLRKGTASSIKSLEGIDDAWVEEAQNVSEDSLRTLSPTVRKDGSQLYFTYNRTDELDPVHVRYVINAPPDTYSRLVNYDVAERAGFFPNVLRVEMEHDRIANPATFSHVWLGEPLGQAEMAIIGRNAILNAMQRNDVEDDGQEEVGVDVARMGNDRSAFWKRKGLKTIGTQTYTKLRLNELADKLEQFVTGNKSILIKIDDTGVGGGLTDIMMERGYNIMPINFGGEPVDKDKYPNWISEAWFHLAEIIDQIQMPMDAELLMELSTRQWKQDNKGKRGVESKGDYKKRGFRSPDLADACIICFYTPPQVKTEFSFV